MNIKKIEKGVAHPCEKSPPPTTYQKKTPSPPTTPPTKPHHKKPPHPPKPPPKPNPRPPPRHPHPNKPQPAPPPPPPPNPPPPPQPHPPQSTQNQTNPIDTTRSTGIPVKKKKKKGEQVITFVEKLSHSKKKPKGRVRVAQKDQRLYQTTNSSQKKTQGSWWGFFGVGPSNKKKWGVWEIRPRPSKIDVFFQKKKPQRRLFQGRTFHPNQKTEL